MIYAWLQNLPYLTISYLYDGVMRYAIAVAQLYKEKRETLGTVTVEEVANDGPSIVKKLKNITFEGKHMLLDETGIVFVN